jgi:hypothetical protein
MFKIILNGLPISVLPSKVGGEKTPTGGFYRSPVLREKNRPTPHVPTTTYLRDSRAAEKQGPTTPEPGGFCWAAGAAPAWPAVASPCDLLRSAAWLSYKIEAELEGRSDRACLFKPFPVLFPLSFSPHQTFKLYSMAIWAGQRHNGAAEQFVADSSLWSVRRAAVHRAQQ